MEEAELDPARVRFRQSGSGLVDRPGPIDVGKGMEADREEGNSTLSTGTPESGSGPRPEMISAPDSPCSSAQLPTPQDPTFTIQPMGSSFDRTCEPSQGPTADEAQYDELTSGQFHDQCPKRGYRKRESKAVLKTRLPTTDATEAQRN